MNKLKNVTSLFLFLFSVAVSAAGDSVADKLDNRAEKGDATALAKLKTGAESGDADYEKAYGDFFYEKKDYRRSVVWYRKSALQGDNIGQVRLASMYEDALGVPKDIGQAMVWYRKAADQGDALGQDALGGAYYRGINGKKDIAQSMFWFRKAADQGDGDGAADLGRAYADLKDNVNAFIWLTKGADRGSESAQEELGYMYSVGINGVVHKNEVIAYALYDLSNNADDIANADWYLTKAQIKTAKALEQRMSKIGVSAAIDEYLKSIHKTK